MDPNHEDDHPSATNSLPLMEDDDDDDDDDYDFGVLYAMPLPLFNSNNLEPNRKLKKGVLVTVEVTTPSNTANTNEFEIHNIIPEEEAICRFCYHQLFPVDNNNNNVMKTKCGCPFTLTHENCMIERKGNNSNNNNNNNKCDVCDQDVSYIPVILSRASSINTKTKVVNKGSSSSSSTLTKWSYFKKGRLCSYAI